MVEETIREIREAEAEADEIIKEAESKRKALLKEASGKAAVLKADILKEARDKAGFLMEEAKAQGALSTKSAAADVEKAIKELRKAAAFKEKEAQELVLSKLI